jgi:ankyrin repeat protein
LCHSAGYGKEAAAVLLLELGADPAAAADRSGMSAVHRAAARCHIPVLRLLLASPHSGGGGAACCCWQRSAAGQTPLMYASQFGHEPAAVLMLEHLAAAAAAAAAGVAAQEDAQNQQEQGAGSSLRQHLALRDAAGLTALHLAAQWGMAGVAEMLLAAGAGELCSAAAAALPLGSHTQAARGICTTLVAPLLRAPSPLPALLPLQTPTSPLAASGG